MKKFYSRAAAGIAVFFVAVCFFSCKSYPPDFEVSDFYSQYSNTVAFSESKKYIEIRPADSQVKSDTGIIFYPGGLVEYKDYIPLLTLFAQKGITCVIVKMPLDFAIFDIGAAGKITGQFPQVKSWYIGGHSLGGAMAASYTARHQEDFEGLILLAAYSTHDLSDSGLKVLSIYGSKDGVLNMKRYQKYKKNLPSVGKGLTEIIIDGGNHGQFANYGAQKGDYMPEISRDEQQKITAEEIINWAGF